MKRNHMMRDEAIRQLCDEYKAEIVPLYGESVRVFAARGWYFIDLGNGPSAYREAQIREFLREKRARRSHAA